MTLVSPIVLSSEPPTSGIYAIVNTATGRRYVGSSSHVSARWRDHVWSLNRDAHENPLLQNAWRKHGSDSFICVLIEACSPADLLTREQIHLDANHNGYNLCVVAGKPPSPTGRTHRMSEESRRRLSILNKAKPPNKVAIQKLSEINFARRGVKRGPLSEARKEHLRQFNTGKKHGPRPLEVRQKISAAKMGRKMLPEQVEKSRLARVGQKLTAEHRARVSEALLAYWVRRRAENAGA